MLDIILRALVTPGPLRKPLLMSGLKIAPDKRTKVDGHLHKGNVRETQV